MANKLTAQGILYLLENGEVSDLEITDDDEDDLAFDGGDDFPGVELDDLLQQFDGNFEHLMDTADDTLVTNDIPLQIPPPRNEFPITQKKNIKWLQQPFQCPTIVLKDLETQVQVDYLRNPIDFFLQYFENDFFEIIAFNTNLYTVQNNNTHFKPTNKHEIQTLIAIHLIMGCLKFPRIRMYWEEKFRVPLISNSMSRDRFLQLRNNLHIINNFDIPCNNVDKFIKVRSLYDQIKKKCNNLPKVRNVCIDEQMVPFKGKLSVKQYMRGKSSPWGIKIFFLASECGIIYDFILY